MKIKKLKKWRNIIQKKNPTKLSWPMGAKSDKSIFYSKRKKNTKLSYPMSAKYDT